MRLSNGATVSLSYLPTDSLAHRCPRRQAQQIPSVLVLLHAAAEALELGAPNPPFVEGDFLQAGDPDVLGGVLDSRLFGSVRNSAGTNRRPSYASRLAFLRGRAAAGSLPSR